MSEQRTQQQTHHTSPIAPFSWWSWRPGIKPRNALLIGSLVSLLAILLAGIGLFTLIIGLLDSASPPIQVPGQVFAHSINALDGQLHLVVHLHKSGFPSETAPVVSQSAYHDIHNGSVILLDYSPRLHLLYALERPGQRYDLPGVSIASALFGSLTLLFIGCIVLPYPAILMIWGWRDLFGEEHTGRQRNLKARVVGLRAFKPTRAGRTGVMPTPARAWYGVALYPINTDDEPQVKTFAISQQCYKTLHEGELVQITYSPHVHYIFALETLKE